MRFIAFEGAHQVAAWSAEYIIDAINTAAPTAQRPFVLGLPTGSTPLATYQRLIQAYQAHRISFEHVVTFNMDEYAGLAKTSPDSYWYFMQHHFFDHIDINPQNTHRLDGGSLDPTSECADFEAKIQELGGVDLFLGGIGSDGHIAFNEPGTSLHSRTRLCRLSERTRMDNARFFADHIARVPTHALSVGIETIMAAKTVVILATGSHKANAISDAIEGSINHLSPISYLQLHRDSIIVSDIDACQELKVKTLKHFQHIERAEIAKFNHLEE